MRSWNDILLPPVSPDLPLPEQVHALLHQQRTTWDLFRNGEAALADIRTKRFLRDGHAVVVQANPGRSISTNAKVDPQSIARRSCFLCPGALPPQERGIAFGEYVILPNPFPIMRDHVTIAFARHVPQQIDGSIDDLLALVKSFGPELFVLYNGPRCGASAPDHLHFQACRSREVPLFEQLPVFSHDNQIVPLSLWDRNLFAGMFTSSTCAASALQRILTALAVNTGEQDGEPMLNIIGLYRDDRYYITLFPRAKHRSSCYFAEPATRLSISPAAIEMAGIVVVADVNHFDRVNEAAVHDLYREVTLDNGLFSRIAEMIT